MNTIKLRDAWDIRLETSKKQMPDRSLEKAMTRELHALWLFQMQMLSGTLQGTFGRGKVRHDGDCILHCCGFEISANMVNGKFVSVKCELSQDHYRFIEISVYEDLRDCVSATEIVERFIKQHQHWVK